MHTTDQIHVGETIEFYCFLDLKYWYQVLLLITFPRVRIHTHLSLYTYILGVHTIFLHFNHEFSQSLMGSEEV